jgi:hypothetical protein
MITKQPQVELDFDIDFWKSSYEYLENKRPSLVDAMTRLIANGATAEDIKRRAKQWTSNSDYLKAVYNAALYIQSQA